MSETAFDEGAPSPGVGATLVPATVAVAMAAVAVPAAAIAGLGAVSMAVGVGRGNRRLHTIGAVTAFAAVLLAGIGGAAPVVTLIGGGAAVLAWDAGEHAIGLGRQVGSDAAARSGVLVHVGASTLTGIAVVVLAALVYVFARAGQPGAAAVVLAVAAGTFALLLSR